MYDEIMMMQTPPAAMTVLAILCLAAVVLQLDAAAPLPRKRVLMQQPAAPQAQLQPSGTPWTVHQVGHVLAAGAHTRLLQPPSCPAC